MKCTVCNGTGKQTTTVTEFGSNKPPEKWEHDCVICDGTGEMTPAMAKAVEYERNMWCKCTGKTNSRYIPDNTKGAAVTKHHYVCNKCGKVTQIG
jgi:Fe2+ or Zn2+ uptake regulation protein